MDLGTSADTRPALGYLPGGTANVATVAFGFETRPARLARALKTMTGRPTDVGIADVGGEARPFLLWCSAGLDAVVIDELNSARTGHMGMTGLAANVPRVLSAVRRYPAHSVRVTVDGVELPPVASVILTNVREIAFGGTLHPRASPFDGQLDVLTVADASPLAVLSAGTRLWTSALTASPGVEHRTATTVAVRGEGRVPVQIDGEPVGHLPVDVRLEKGAIRLLVGRAILDAAGADAAGG
jgi:diacylglycerol kinase (ATP)